MARALTPEDLYALVQVEHPALSPDGTRLAFVRTTVNRETYAYERAIWMVPTAGGEPVRFSAGPDDTWPRWSPDGHSLAFIRAPRPGATPANARERARGVGKPQLWLLPAAGGEARQLTSLPHGAGEHAWSPDGRTLAFTAQTGEPDDAEVDQAALEGVHVPRIRTIEQLWYRLDGTGYIYDLRSHVFALDVAQGEAVGEPRQLTDGDWNDAEPTWSPDGSRIAFTSDRSSERWRWPAASLWVLDLAEGALTRLTDEALACASPAWAPDGATLAFLAAPRRHGVGHTDLYVVASAPPTGQQRMLTQDFVPDCGDTCMDDQRGSHLAHPLTWSTDGVEVYFQASMRGTTHLYAARPAENLLPRRLTDGLCRIYAYSFDARRQTLALAISDPQTPGDLYVQRLGAAAAGGAEARQRLTAVNAELLAEVELATPEEMTFHGADSWEMQGWVLRPVTPPATPGPAILQVHGGPATMYGYSFFLEFQLLAGQGYTVVYCNPRGSTGYGRIFSGAVINDWGGKDAVDVQAALDAALARGGLDPTRLGVAGGSYGGYMTNWLVGHTDRFRAAVTMRSVTNMATMFGTSDIGWDLAIDALGAAPWDEPERLASFSPITYVKAIHTPLLILHSDQDLRCPIGEAEQLYAALKYLGRTVRYVRFEEQSHDLSRTGHPRARVRRLHEIVDWFERHMAAAPR